MPVCQRGHDVQSTELTETTHLVLNYIYGEGVVIASYRYIQVAIVEAKLFEMAKL